MLSKSVSNHICLLCYNDNTDSVAYLTELGVTQLNIQSL